MAIQRRRLVGLLGLALGAAACGGGDQGMHIAVIPKGTTNEFWQSIHAGAVKAERELQAEGIDARITWKGPIREDDREQQIQVVEGFLSQGVSGLVLAPLDSSALVRPVEEARRAGIPTVVIDSDLDSDVQVSFVATDNYQGGVLAADRIASMLGGTGNALLLRYQEGSASTTARERGFLERLASAHPGITVISSDQYAGATRDTAKRASENLINRFGADMHAVFTPNESSTAGMLLALQDVGRAGKVRFVGFDASETFVAAMRQGHLDGIVLQNPFEMGYRGVKIMAAHLRGESVDARIDTGVRIVTPETLDSPESQLLLKPPVAEYLGS